MNLYVASAAAPILTAVAKSIHFPMNTDSEISSLLDGGNPFRFWMVKIFEGNLIALGLIPVIFITCLLLYRMTTKQLQREAHEERAAAAQQAAMTK